MQSHFHPSVLAITETIKQGKTTKLREEGGGGEEEQNHGVLCRATRGEGFECLLGEAGINFSTLLQPNLLPTKLTKQSGCFV